VTDDKICPICQLNSKPEWAACCEWCWNFIGWIDEFYKTDYRKRLTEGKPVVIWERLEIKNIECYFPLPKEDCTKRARKIVRDICDKCNKEIEDGCEQCVWHSLMQSIIGEEIW